MQEEMLTFIALHIEFFIGLLFAGLGFVGLGGLKHAILAFDKERKVEFLVRETHDYLDRIKDKTTTTLDDKLEVVFAAALDFLERKEEFVSLSGEEQRRVLGIAKSVVVKKLTGKKSEQG